MYRYRFVLIYLANAINVKNGIYTWHVNRSTDVLIIHFKEVCPAVPKRLPIFHFIKVFYIVCKTN